MPYYNAYYNTMPVSKYYPASISITSTSYNMPYSTSTITIDPATYNLDNGNSSYSYTLNNTTTGTHTGSAYTWTTYSTENYYVEKTFYIGTIPITLSVPVPHVSITAEMLLETNKSKSELLFKMLTEKSRQIIHDIINENIKRDPDSYDMGFMALVLLHLCKCEDADMTFVHTLQGLLTRDDHPPWKWVLPQEEYMGLMLYYGLQLMGEMSCDA